MVERFKAIAQNSLLAISVVAAHAVLAIVIISLITGVREIIDFVNSDRLLAFGVPLAYIFDFANFSVLLVFVAQSVMSAMTVLKINETKADQQRDNKLE